MAEVRWAPQAVDDLEAIADFILEIRERRTGKIDIHSQEKTFVQIPRANHNDIFIRDLNAYMQAVRNLADVVTKG
ncbi:MAG: hypothetical protein R6U55_06185 [Desulfovermiculus sp.]